MEEVDTIRQQTNDGTGEETDSNGNQNKQQRMAFLDIRTGMFRAKLCVTEVYIHLTQNYKINICNFHPPPLPFHKN